MEKGLFCEQTTRNGNRYGTLKSDVNEMEADPRVAVWIKDIEGMNHLRVRYGAENVVPIAILPPSEGNDLQEIRWRIVSRASGNVDERQKEWLKQ